MAATRPPNASATRAAAGVKWRLLQLLNLFRGVAAGLLVIVFLVDEPPRLLGGPSPALFLFGAVAYLVLTLLFAISLVRRSAGVERQTFAQLGADLICVPLMIHASGGLSSGLAALLVVSVIASSFLLRERYALLVAATATLLLLYEQSLARLEDLASAAGWAQVATFGAMFFATALIGSRLARRAYESEELAQRRGADLADLAQLNDQIVEHLQTGVVVVDDDGTLTQLNASAAAFLGVHGAVRGQRAREVAPTLAALLDAWREAPAHDPPSFPAAGDGRPIMPRVMPVGASGRRALLVFLEDPRLQSERVQDVKLAALGRLTASIAHEVRNPLAALSHANQLLAESERLGAEERRFTGIIDHHVARVDAIVDSVLALGRPGAGRAAEVDLERLLRDAVDEFVRAHPAARVELAPVGREVPVRVDPTHLHQIVTNLLSNALKHGAGSDGVARIAVRCQRLPSGEAIVEVEDAGPGVPEQVALHIFEPFYSGSSRGTGLGLFIARELCAANRASLSYQRAPAGGACFRITFPSPERWVV
jgi:two-component system sensor histidine kinase PilS (NtrC family)